MMPTVLRDPGVGETLDEYYVEVDKDLRIKIRIAEVKREDGSTEYCCFADEPPLTDLERRICAEALREIGPSEGLWVREYEELYNFFAESLRRAASKLRADLTEEQEGRLLYYVVRESLYSILVPFMIDENIESIKVEEPEFNVLVVQFTLL